MNIRRGEAHEIQKFGLYSPDNEGVNITVVEVDGAVVAFAQHSGTTIYILESEHRGAGRALVEYIIDGADYAAAVNVTGVSEGFWAKLGFEPEGCDGYGQPVWTWYREDD